MCWQPDRAWRWSPAGKVIGAMRNAARVQRRGTPAAGSSALLLLLRSAFAG
jgi:hypothetical protein